jgi:hypothetical protein
VGVVNVLRVRLAEAPMLYVPRVEGPQEPGLVTVVRDLRWTSMGWKVQLNEGAWYGVPHELRLWAVTVHKQHRAGTCQFPSAWSFRTCGHGTLARLLSRPPKGEKRGRTDGE